MNSSFEPNVNSNHKENCKSNKPYKFDFKCGDPGQALFPFSPGGTTATVATVTIDTSEFCNPCTKLEFTSNLIGVIFAGILNFQIFKYCDKQQPIPIGPQFSYQVTVATATRSDEFSFFICDCDSCNNECCTYAVVVTVGGVSVVGNIGVFAARLMATTAEQSVQKC